jgi:hypothetical protein
VDVDGEASLSALADVLDDLDLGASPRAVDSLRNGLAALYLPDEASLLRVNDMLAVMHGEHLQLGPLNLRGDWMDVVEPETTLVSASRHSDESER